MKEPKFDLRDICLIPTIISEINSRSECNIMTDHNFLPLMAAPMDTVVSKENYTSFLNNDIIPCLPRECADQWRSYDTDYFQAFGLNDIEEHLRIFRETDESLIRNRYDKFVIKDSDKNFFFNYSRVLIDIANGHMHRLIGVIKEIKKSFPYITLMVGNVANPLTFKNLAMAGADYVRISIGTGAGCTTAANVAINYPMGSLIHECRNEKVKGGYWNTMIVADGGMQGYDDIIKALALGADYVMIGSLFNKAMQSAGDNYLFGIKVGYDLAKRLWKWGLPIKKKYRGMSTKAVQRKWGKTKLVTAEGITKYQRVEYNLTQWVENFKDYLRSSMSYCGAKKLDDFVGYAEWEYITYNAFKRFKK